VFINNVNTPMLFIVVGLLYLTIPVMTWIVLSGSRSRPVTFWCAGSLLFGSGLLLVGLRGSISEWATLPVANLLVFIGYLLHIQALRLELAAPWRLIWMIAASLAFVLIFEGIRLGLGDVLLRLQFISLLYGFMSLLLGILAWRIGRLYDSSNAYFVFVICVLGLLGFLGRFIELINNQLDGVTPDVMAASIITVQGAVIGVLCSIGTHFGYIGMSLDRLIRSETAIKTAKLVAINQSQEIIARLDRQRSLGAMSASLGHEINQPLTAILANAQIAKRGIDQGLFKPSQIETLLDKIIHNTRRANLIIEKIRGFIRPASLERRSIDLGEIVRDTALFVKEDAFVHKVDIIFAIDGKPLLVLGDAIQLSQVLLNLYRNAIEVLQHEKQRKLYISVCPDENWIVITVRDTGSGLTEEGLTRVGEPFYSTKDDGLGLGLSISKSIIEQHGGQIIISNAEEGGACFKIRLPAHYHLLT
jgi:signal transduction histidine kinase